MGVAVVDFPLCFKIRILRYASNRLNMAYTHRHMGNFRPGRAVNHLPKFLQNSPKETRAIRCNNIGRTGI